MSSYRRILAFVALTADAEALVRRAVQLSRLHGASLALVTVVDFVAGYECDRYPVVSGDEMREAIAADVRNQLDRLLTGARGGAEIIVARGHEADAVDHTLRAWRPDLVLVAQGADHGVPARGASGFDLLTVGSGGWQNVAGRLINALAASL